MKKPPKKSPMEDASTKPQKTDKRTRPFPRATLTKSLEIAQKIKEKNGGNAWSSEEIAKAVGFQSKKNNKFFYQTAASRDFGLTTGTRDTPQISLTPLGREIVYAPDAETRHQKKLEAFNKIDLFRKVLEHYKGPNLPEMEFLGNTLLDTFNLPAQFHEEFARLFKENCKDLGITSESLLGSSVDSDIAGGGTVVVGTPTKGQSKKKLFVIMPFEERDKRPKGFFNEVLDSLLTPGGVAAGFTVETARRQGSDVIQSSIINDLIEADLVLADLTDHNPNVLFELGVRIAKDKPVVLIKASDTGRIFDVDNLLRVYEYNPNLWASTLKKDLKEITAHVTGAWENRNSQQSYMKILTRRPEEKEP